MRRTGDHVHCAAASATYGRAALTRQRGHGIRENPPPVPGEPRPCLLLCAGGPRQRRAWVLRQLALCGPAGLN